MIPEQQAPLVLEAMTLRGIGSYLHGARLEIKPLTILCGENGAGKSTWLKALNILEESFDTLRLPFGFKISDWDPHNLQLTNAFYHLADPSEFAKLSSDGDNEKFGPPGTIGIELRASKDNALEDVQRDHEEGIAKSFLWFGRWVQNSRIRMRFAHPTYHDDSTPTPELFHLVELQLDGKHTIRMVGERDPLQKFEEGHSRPRRSKPYTLSCSMSFVTGLDNDWSEIADIAIVTDLLTPRVTVLRQGFSSVQAANLLWLFEKRLRQLVGVALKGYFRLGAIRKPNTSLSVNVADQPTDAQLAKRRYVGAEGEFAWRLERCFGENRMRGKIDANFKRRDMGTVWRSLPKASEPKLARIWERAHSAKREHLEELLESDELGASLQAPEACADLLNQLLDDRGLFNTETWAREVEYCNEDGDLMGIDYRIDDPEIQSLLEEGIDSLSMGDVRRLNFLLICDALETVTRFLPTEQQCKFLDYLSCWLFRLVDVTLNSPEVSADRHDQWTVGERCYPDDERYSGFNHPTPFILEPGSYHELDSSQSGLARLSHPCFGHYFGTVQVPRQLSAGFHQLFPIIVQLGLMRAGELFGIENPEVHLHPSLQLRVTEALLVHAVSGRRILVETHSDLVIRRVIRAILEEEIGQSQVQIYFAGLNQMVTTSHPHIPISFSSSKLEQIRFDEHGRIANWPPGFLDDDVRESQRLMDIMYGNVGQEPSDDDQP